MILEIFIVAIFLLYVIFNFTLKTGSQDFLYHGSDIKIKTLEPRPSKVIGGEKAVFATPNIIDAAIFSAQWTDYDFAFGSTNGKKYLTERYPGAFKKLNREGYIHFVDKKLFHNDERLPKSELICYDHVEVIKIEKINVLKMIKKSDLIMISFEKLLKGIRKNPPIETDIKVNILYIPIDSNWNISEKLKAKHFRGPQEIKDVSEADDIILDQDFSDFECAFDDIKYNKKYLVVPKVIKYYGSKKTTEEEYMKFIESQKKIYKDLEILELE